MRNGNQTQKPKFYNVRIEMEREERVQIVKMENQGNFSFIDLLQNLTKMKKAE